MDMTGTYRIAAAPARVWAALNDPAVLKASIPGCESVTKVTDTEMDAVASVALGPVKARFKGKVHLRDLDPPHGYTIAGEGTGGPAGFAKGEAKVRLAPDGGGTTLTYTVHASIGGKLAQLGQRLIDGAAKKMADDFFARFAALAAETDAGGSPDAKKSAFGVTIKSTQGAHGATTPRAAPARKSPKPAERVFEPPLWWPVAICIVSIAVLAFTLIR